MNAWIIERRKRKTTNLWRPDRLALTQFWAKTLTNVHNRLDDKYEYRWQKYVRKP